MRRHLVKTNTYRPPLALAFYFKWFCKIAVAQETSTVSTSEPFVLVRADSMCSRRLRPSMRSYAQERIRSQFKCLSGLAQGQHACASARFWTLLDGLNLLSPLTNSWGNSWGRAKGREWGSPSNPRRLQKCGTFSPIIIHPLLFQHYASLSRIKIDYYYNPSC